MPPPTMTETEAATRAAPSESRPHRTEPARQYPYYVIRPIESDRVRRFLEAFGAILRYTNYKGALDLFARSGTKCSRCSTTCPVFRATGDARDIPCHRTNLLLRVYRRHFTTAGWLRAKVTGDPGLTDADIDEMQDLFYRCTACRRCTLECPMGIDHGLVTHLGRYILSELGIIPKGLEIAVKEQLEGATGNTSAIPPHALVDTLEFLEEEILDTVGVELSHPIDEPDREYIFFPAVSDYLMEPETLMGNALTLWAAGDWDRWTTGTGYFDGINYGLFYSDHVLERIIRKLTAEAGRLRARTILIGECGHASRSGKDFVPVFGDPKLPVVNFMEYTHRAITEGRLRLDPDAVPEVVTYHDPCNIARSGWIVDQPREIIRAFCRNFVDMTPGGRHNYCCGGGGGTVSVDEIHDFRMSVAGRTKAEQLRATGARYCIAPCANCKKQLKELVEHHELEMEVVGLHDLLLRAIRLDGQERSAWRRKQEENGGAS